LEPEPFCPPSCSGALRILAFVIRRRTSTQQHPRFKKYVSETDRQTSVPSNHLPHVSLETNFLSLTCLPIDSSLRVLPDGLVTVNGNRETLLERMVETRVFFAIVSAIIPLLLPRFYFDTIPGSCRT